MADGNTSQNSTGLGHADFSMNRDEVEKASKDVGEVGGGLPQTLRDAAYAVSLAAAATGGHQLSPAMNAIFAQIESAVRTVTAAVDEHANALQVVAIAARDQEAESRKIIKALSAAPGTAPHPDSRTV